VSSPYFILTGCPKSGTHWIQELLFRLKSVTIRAANRDLPRPPIPARHLVEDQRLVSALDRAGVSRDSFLKKWINPREPGGLPPRDPDRRDLSERLAVVLKSILNRHTPISPEVISKVLSPPDRRGAAGRKGLACIARHIPVDTLRRTFPSFKVVNIVRDPRDVMVSAFYHRLSHLNLEEKEIFCRRDGRTGKVGLNPDWKRPFFSWHVDLLYDFYSGWSLDESCRVVRFEDLLVDAVAEVGAILDFLEVEEDPAVVRSVVEKYSFERRTGGMEERRHSLIRKGQAGDWRNYFDRELLGILGRPFRDLLVRLGYEKDDRWADKVPERAPREWDFARFRLKRSTCVTFMSVWRNSAELQERYPVPLEYGSDDCFYTWLRRADRPRVREWFADVDELHRLWKVDIEDRPER
jgi:hypothetical protein